MAAPYRPSWDLAIAAQEWAPLYAPGARLSHADDPTACELVSARVAPPAFTSPVIQEGPDSRLPRAEY